MKTIHYCWFGGNAKSDLILKCIESWKKYCPQYKIIEWNEKNFDIHCCKYVEEAYEEKRWAFVSDYCRFFVLYNYGGIYLDTDVELLKSLETLPETFIGFESKKNVASGLIRGALPGDVVCREMLDSYNKDTFKLQNGDLNLKTVVQRETEIFQKYGLILNNKHQRICGTDIFPSDYFSPYNYVKKKLKITQNTYSIHHFAATWLTEEEQYSAEVARKLSKILPGKLAGRMAHFIAICHFQGIRKAFQYIMTKIKKK